MFTVKRVAKREKNIICVELTDGQNVAFSVVFDTFLNGKRYMLLHPVLPFHGCEGDGSMLFRAMKVNGEFCIQPEFDDAVTEEAAKLYRAELKKRNGK